MSKYIKKNTKEIKIKIDIEYIKEQIEMGSTDIEYIKIKTTNKDKHIKGD